MGAQTLNSELMSELANSYIDRSYADSYWTNDYRAGLSTVWGGLTNAQKDSALIDACRMLESIRFTLPDNLRDYALYYDRRTRLVRTINRERDPFKYVYSQKLQFPRNLDIYVKDPPSPELMGEAYVPPDVMDAQCEQAIYILTADESIYIKRLQGIKQESVGLGKQSLVESTTYDTALSGSASMLAPRAVEKLRPYMVLGGKYQRS